MVWKNHFFVSKGDQQHSVARIATLIEKVIPSLKETNTND